MNRIKKKVRTKRLGKLRISKNLREFFPKVSRISVIIPSNWQKQVLEEKDQKPLSGGVMRRSN